MRLKIQFSFVIKVIFICFLCDEIHFFNARTIFIPKNRLFTQKNPSYPVCPGAKYSTLFCWIGPKPLAHILFMVHWSSRHIFQFALKCFAPS